MKMDETEAAQLWRQHLADQAGEPEEWLWRIAAEVERFRLAAQDRRGYAGREKPELIQRLLNEPRDDERTDSA